MKKIIFAISTLFIISGCVTGSSDWVVKNNRKMSGVVSYEVGTHNEEDNRMSALSKIQSYCGGSGFEINKELGGAYETTREDLAVNTTTNYVGPYNNAVRDHQLTTETRPTRVKLTFLEFKCR